MATDMPSTNFNVRLLKRLLLAFWAVWLTLVSATNFCDLAKVLELLPRDWPFASGNVDQVVAATARYGAPAQLNVALFMAVLIWETTAALAFYRAAWTYGGRENLMHVHRAFGVSLMLWAAFMFADEVCMQYPIEASHMRIFTSQMVTLLVIHLIPEDEGPSSH
ncbi:MAG: hypothetical protein K2R98_29720 [Gemmataceae bacterium]|nr:hypothetical protein [Gemmataceae bacterium]